MEFADSFISISLFLFTLSFYFFFLDTPSLFIPPPLFLSPVLALSLLPTRSAISFHLHLLSIIHLIFLFSHPLSLDLCIYLGAGLTTR